MMNIFLKPDKSNNVIIIKLPQRLIDHIDPCPLQDHNNMGQDVYVQRNLLSCSILYCITNHQLVLYYQVNLVPSLPDLSRGGWGRGYYQVTSVM